MTLSKEVNDLKVQVVKLETRFDSMEKYLSATARDVRAIRDAALSVKGGWKMMVLLMSVAAAIGALAAKIAPFVGGMAR